MRLESAAEEHRLLFDDLLERVFGVYWLKIIYLAPKR